MKPDPVVVDIPEIWGGSGSMLYLYNKPCLASKQGYTLHLHPSCRSVEASAKVEAECEEVPTEARHTTPQNIDEI